MMTEEKIRRPGVLKSPPTFGSNRSDLNKKLLCRWIIPIMSLEEHKKSLNKHILPLKVAIAVFLLVGSLPLFLIIKGVDTSFFLWSLTISFLSLSLFGSLLLRWIYSVESDPKKEHYTFVYWKPIGIEQKEIIVKELISLLGKKFIYQRIKENEFKGDTPEHIFRFENGTCMRINYQRAGRGWTMEGTIKIGYTFDKVQQARYLQMKVDEFLHSRGAA